jgi:CheY-like chemotaxis protein
VEDSKKHILVVDDQEMIADSFKRYLEHNGYRVSMAYDGISALDVAKHDPIDALITDFRMPGMNGQELLAELRKLQPELPAILVSAYTGEIAQDINRNTKLFSKPVILNRLLTTLSEMLSENLA